MSGCVDEFLLNGERLPLDGATDRFDVQQVGEVSQQCGDVIVPPFTTDSPGGATVGQPSWRLPVIIVGAIVGICLVVLLILIVVFCIRRRRSPDNKGIDSSCNRRCTCILFLARFTYTVLTSLNTFRTYEKLIVYYNSYRPYYKEP